MAGQRLTDKSGLAQQTAGDDILMVVDVSDTTGSAQGTSKKIEAKNIISVASVSLSSAQIQALHTSAVVLLHDHGSGFMYLVHSLFIFIILNYWFLSFCNFTYNFRIINIKNFFIHIN